MTQEELVRLLWDMAGEHRDRVRRDGHSPVADHYKQRAEALELAVFQLIRQEQEWDQERLIN